MPIRALGPLARPLRCAWALAVACAWAVAQTGNPKEVWTVVRSPHFTVQGNGSEAQLREVALHFEGIREVFRSTFPRLRVDPGIPTSIVAAKDEDTMKRMLPDFWSGGHTKVAGLFLTRRDGNYAVLNLAAKGGELPYHTVYHEYTHGIIHLNFPTPPVWLNEGLAEFYGNTEFGRSETGVGKIGSWQLRLLQERPLIPLLEFLAVDHRSPHYSQHGKASLFYAQSWLMVHFLLMDPEAVKAQWLSRYLQALDASQGPKEAAEQAFGDLKAFEDRLRAYCRRFSFHYLRLKPFEHLDEATFSARALSPSAGVAVWSRILALHHHEEEARAHLQHAIEAEPTLAAARLALGEVELHAGHLESAETALREAARLDPSEFLAPFLLARCLERKGGSPPPSPDEIRALLLRAAQLNPAFAPAQALLGKAYLYDITDPGKALSYAYRAVELDPSDLHYLATLGHAYLRAKRPAEALEVGRRLALYARTANEKAIVTEFQALLDQYGVNAESSARP